MRLSDFKALSFDCYGTLIDWESGIIGALAAFRERSGASPDDVLEAFGLLESAVEEEDPSRPYSRVLEEVHARLSRHFGVQPDPPEAALFGASVGSWPAFPDSADALSYLKRHFKLIILSNVDRRSFEGSERRLGVAFDHVFTAQDIGSYRPDLRNFEYLLEQAGAAGIA
ncbi:MAG TPA: HAD family hydrolase, partial [Sphingomicrobium sp.]|nr:HAD family hydrolase [Sphingomicrobium sp.]